MDRQETLSAIQNANTLQKYIHISQLLLSLTKNNNQENHQYFLLLQKNQFNLKALLQKLKYQQQQNKKNINIQNQDQKEQFQEKILYKSLEQNKIEANFVTLEQQDQQIIIYKKQYQIIQQTKKTYSSNRELFAENFVESIIQGVSHLYSYQQIYSLIEQLNKISKDLDCPFQILGKIIDKLENADLVEAYETFYNFGFIKNEKKLQNIKRIKSEQINKKYTNDIGKIKHIQIFGINHQIFIQKMVQILQFVECSDKQLNYFLFLTQKQNTFNEKVKNYCEYMSQQQRQRKQNYNDIFKQLWNFFMKQIQLFILKISKGKLWQDIPIYPHIIYETLLNKGLQSAIEQCISELEKIFKFIYSRLFSYSIQRSYIIAGKQRKINNQGC